MASWLDWHGLVVERVERESLLRDGLGFGRSWSLVVLTGPLFFLCWNRGVENNCAVIMLCGLALFAMTGY